MGCWYFYLIVMREVSDVCSDSMFVSIGIQLQYVMLFCILDDYIIEEYYNIGLVMLRVC